jgi:hypothetical protein
MTRTLRLISSKQKGFVQSWDYPSSRRFCTFCGNRFCFDPIEVDGRKSMNKCKGTHATTKRYTKFSFYMESIDDGVDDDG